MSASRIFPIAIAAPLLLSPAFSQPAAAGERFSQQRLDPNTYVLVAAPDRHQGNRRLVVIEELGQGLEPCWPEQQKTPTLIEPVMLSFDSQGRCNYRTNTEGYSIQVAGEDLDDYYQLQLIEHDGDLLLLGRPEIKGEASLLIGRSRGAAEFAKIELLPGWNLAQQVHNGQALKQLYLTTEQSLAQIGDPLQPASSNSTISIQPAEIELALPN